MTAQARMLQQMNLQDLTNYLGKARRRDLAALQMLEDNGAKNCKAASELRRAIMRTDHALLAQFEFLTACQHAGINQDPFEDKLRGQP